MRMILTQQTVNEADVVGGAVIDMPAEADRPGQTFWVGADEAEPLIRALAKNFGLNLAAMD